MAIKRIKKNMVYGITDDILAMPPQPIVAQRAPTTADYAEIGTLWIDQPNDDAYVVTKVAAKSATWINTGGGSGTFTSVTTTAGIIAGTTIFAGSTIESTTTVTVGTNLTVSGLGRGVVQSSAAGLFSSSEGTDGQLLISSSAGAAAWATITAGAGILVTNANNSITIDATGATASTFPTDVAGPVSPLAGATTLAGGTNITTDGSVANTVTFNLDDNVNLAGSLTAGVDLTMSTGTCTISADDDVAQAIYLHTNGGTNETIEIYADQGTSAASIYVHSDVGGIDLTSGLASADAINITCSDAAGGIDVDYGTGGMSVIGANGAFTVETGIGAINIGADAAAKAIVIGNATGATSVALNCGTGACNIGTSATAHTTTVGSTTGAASTVIQAGTGDLLLTSTDDMTLDAAGVLEFNSSAGIIGIGIDADDFAINVGTLGNRTITVGVVGGTTGLRLNAGSGNAALASDGTIDIDGVGVVSVNSSGAAINVGNDADDFALNLGTAGNRTITVGATGGTSALILNGGSGNITTACDGTVDIDSAGAVSINSSGATLGLGNDADAYAINIGTGAAQRDITIGNITGTTGVDINAGSGDINITSTDSIIGLVSGSGAINIGADAAAKSITLGNTTGATAVSIDSGTGGIDINAAGIVTMTPATDTQAAAAVTIDANVGVGVFTGLTTAAAGSQVLTVTNSICTVDSAILCTLANKGANDAQCTITRVIPGAGSFTVTYQNLGAAALNDDLILTFWIIA